MIVDDLYFDPKIVLNLEATTEGLSITCGSCTSQKGFLDWRKTYPNNEKIIGFQEVAALIKVWESEGKKYITNYTGLTEAEIKIAEGREGNE